VHFLMKAEHVPAPSARYTVHSGGAVIAAAPVPSVQFFAASGLPATQVPVLPKALLAVAR